VAKLTVVIPVHNEVGNVEPLYHELADVLRTIPETTEILFIDDGSTDGTGEVLRNLQGASFIRLRVRCGKSAAYAAGFAAAKGEIIVTMDGDLQDDPHDLPRLLEVFRHHQADLVNGAKTGKGSGGRTVASRIFNRTVRSLTGLDLQDLNCPFKIYRADLTGQLELYGELYRFIPLLAHLRGFKVVEAPVANRPRLAGHSKYGLGKLPHGFLDLLTVLFLYQYRFRPLHLFGGLGILVGGIGFAINLGLTLRYLVSVPHTIGDHKPLLIAGVLMLIVGVQLFSTGLIGELIARGQAAGRPEYDIVEEVRRGLD